MFLLLQFYVVSSVRLIVEIHHVWWVNFRVRLVLIDIKVQQWLTDSLKSGKCSWFLGSWYFPKYKSVFTSKISLVKRCNISKSPAQTRQWRLNEWKVEAVCCWDVMSINWPHLDNILTPQAYFNKLFLSVICFNIPFVFQLYNITRFISLQRLSLITFYSLYSRN